MLCRVIDQTSDRVIGRMDRAIVLWISVSAFDAIKEPRPATRFVRSIEPVRSWLAVDVPLSGMVRSINSPRLESSKDFLAMDWQSGLACIRR